VAALQVKSKFDAEFRRFSISRDPPPSMEEFRELICTLHGLGHIPFTLCYTAAQGELLPITNDDVRATRCCVVFPMTNGSLLGLCCSSFLFGEQRFICTLNALHCFSYAVCLCRARHFRTCHC